MVQIYKDTRTDKLYALEEHITKGTKVCLVPFEHGEDKFVAPSTLKRWFTKWGEEQVLVEVRTFTGMRIGLYRVADYGKTSYSVFTKKGLLTFERSSDFRQDDRQSNAKNPKFANKVTRTIGFFIPTWINNN